jgi:N-acetylmuramoyl-L-alanine amidase
MLVALDIGHRNKPARPRDRGAGRDLSGTGRIERHEWEDWIVAEYFALTRGLLEEQGVDVIDGFSGTYRQRNQWADEMRCDVYLAGHINAGGGIHGLVAHDHRAPRGGGARTLASFMADEWRRRLGLGRVRVVEAGPHGSPSEQRLFNLIRHVRAPALVLEPLFIDGHASRLTDDVRQQTLMSVAEGIVAALLAVQARGLL